MIRATHEGGQARFYLEVNEQPQDQNTAERAWKKYEQWAVDPEQEEKSIHNARAEAEFEVRSFEFDKKKNDVLKDIGLEVENQSGPEMSSQNLSTSESSNKLKGLGVEGYLGIGKIQQPGFFMPVLSGTLNGHSVEVQKLFDKPGYHRYVGTIDGKQMREADAKRFFEKFYEAAEPDVSISQRMPANLDNLSEGYLKKIEADAETSGASDLLKEIRL